MKQILIPLALTMGLTTALPAAAKGVLNCDDLVDKLTKRLESKKVQDFVLKVVPAKEKHAGKVLGRCERGTMKVVRLSGKAAEAEQNQ